MMFRSGSVAGRLSTYGLSSLPSTAREYVSGYLLSTFSALILTVTLPFCRGICLYS